MTNLQQLWQQIKLNFIELVNIWQSFLRFVANNFSFIDPERVAVTGVSYGGYVAGLMLADRAKDVLACGVAVTPVVDWRFYGI